LLLRDKMWIERGTRSIRSICICLPFLLPAACHGQQDNLAEQILNASPEEIAADTALSEYVMKTAANVIPDNCAGCHGAGLGGQPGVPNLTDYDWLWGSATDYSAVGAVMSIQRTLLYGIRNRDCPPDQQSYGACSNTRFSQMPAYGKDGAFTADQIRDLTEYVLDLGGQAADAEAVARAQSTREVCVECHGEYGEGNPDYGGPGLGDDITLYGGDRESIYDVIYNGREGICPPWGKTLDAATIKSLAIYLYNQSNTE